MEAGEVATAIGVELVGKLAHGEGAGAYEIAMPDGTRAVLKVDADDVLDFGNASRFTEALRARGYPAPACLAHGDVHGVAYEITEMIAGRPIERIAAAHLPQLLALNALQREVGVPGREPWLAHMIGSLTHGCEGYCELDAIHAYDPALLERLQEATAGAHAFEAPTRDVVHYDFSAYNILGDDDRVTGVVDWQGATSGDATFDLVTLAYYTYDLEVCDALLTAAKERTDPRALQLYAAHMVLRQVDWSLRHHDDAQVWWHRGIGEALLDTLG